MIYSCGICGLASPNGLGSHSANDCALGLKRENERLHETIVDLKQKISRHRASLETILGHLAFPEYTVSAREIIRTATLALEKNR